LRGKFGILEKIAGAANGDAFEFGEVSAGLEAVGTLIEIERKYRDGKIRISGGRGDYL
jgi:hypothetical protein